MLSIVSQTWAKGHVDRISRNAYGVFWSMAPRVIARNGPLRPDLTDLPGCIGQDGRTGFDSQKPVAWSVVRDP